VNTTPTEHSVVAVKGSSDGGFQALPEGAFVGSEAFYVVNVRSEGLEHNAYVVEEALPVLPCPNLECGYLENPPGEAACLVCGASLTGVIPVHKRHQLLEYRDQAALAVAARVAELGLDHPGLLLHRYFAERPYGQDDRYYLLLPDPPLLLASRAPVPQKIARVLDWGAQLADGLIYLHSYNLGWQQVSADHVVLRERRAMWSDFTAVREFAPDLADAARQKASDVTGLARVLFYMATGADTYTPQAGLPEPAAQAFERVLGDAAEITGANVLCEALVQAVAAVRRPQTVRLRMGRHTDVGMVRDLNEDSLLTLELDRVQCSVSRPIGLYVVADGMGGHAAGDVASGLVVDTIAEKMVTHLLAPQLTGDTDAEAFDAQGWLADAIQAANQAVLDRRDEIDATMGTTLVAALVIGDVATVANVGDSRAYLINEEGIRQITTDHSLVERLVALGQITPGEARVHPQRNVIYRTIGDKEEAEIDFFAQTLKPGDSLLLCSDGLSGKVEDAEIWRLVKRSRSPQEACEQLVQAANDRGGGDNITVILVQAQ
jgi:serine/threonine protein phosphatase PrpC